jgi:outer membrane murein-binding lipoprotein Lpp
MKRILGLLVAGSLLFASCQKSTKDQAADNQLPEATQRLCAADEVLQAQMQADPGLKTRMDEIEAFTQRAIQTGAAERVLVNGVIQIPVVVNVIYNTAAENVSDAQIQSQIDVLNEDFNATNPDFGSVPALFSGVKANVGIQFVLSQTIRKFNSKTSWRTNDDMKRSSRGGIDPTDPTNKLNMWVVNRMTSGGLTILGYAQFPGGPLATDGVVIGYRYFGRIGTAVSPFNKGRTATHEVGHWMNLRHIWGDATCGNDLVGDTPQHNTSNGGCPAYPHLSTCAGTPVEMTMNYMDYTNDACMYMFSAGQKARMLAVFAAGGPRAAMGM